MKYFSMFSGIGGFELGINRAFSIWDGAAKVAEPETPKQGVEPATASPSNNRTGTSSTSSGKSGQVLCVGYSEIDKYAIKVYERHFEHDNYGDATTINPSDLPDFELLVGGFPCQAFSVAGKRAGFNDTRGTLFFDIARILAEKRPRHLVLENVKGLLSHDSGKTFQTILGVLADLGYRVEWQVLNSKDFGVPQNRERIFIVGHLRGECGRKVFPIRQDGSRVAQRQSTVSGEVQAEKPRTDSGYTDEPLPQDGQDRHIHQLNQPTHSNDRVYGTDGVSPTLNTMQGGNRQPFIRTPLRFLNRNQKKIEGDYAFTVDASQTSGISNGARIRRLTPRECERLQGFPSDWTKYGINDEPISDTQRYKMCGNAVTVNVVEAVMKGLIEHDRN